MSFKDRFTVTRTRVTPTPETIADHKFREKCAVALVLIAAVTEVIAIWRGSAWWAWLIVTALGLAAFWVYFHVSISITVPVIERWKARRASRGHR